MDATPTPQDLIDFVLHEAELLNDRQYEAWNDLFADDGFYWVPLTPGQPDGLNHTSHLYEDRLLRTLRIERLKNRRAFSQQPPSRSHHLLQTPRVCHYDPQQQEHRLRTEFHYTEAQGERLLTLVGSCWHHLTLLDGALRIRLKRVDLINSDAALPAVQLFP